MKNLQFFLIGLSALLFTNCSDDDTNKIDTDKKAVPIELISSAATIEPFEKIDIKFNMNDEDLKEYYDSIVWIADGKWDNGVRTINPENNPLDNLREKKITHYTLGKHTVKVYGYKDGNISSIDSIDFEVKQPTGNFLSMKWNSAKEDYGQKFVTGLTPYNYGAYRKGVIMGISHFIKTKKNQSEYVILDYMPWSSGSDGEIKPDLSFEEEWAQTLEEIKYTRTLWHDYLTSIYGKSNCLYEGEDVRETNLWDEYNNLFKNPLGDKIYPWYAESYPVEIWKTSEANICLFSVYNGWYYVIAEPK